MIFVDGIPYLFFDYHFGLQGVNNLWSKLSVYGVSEWVSTCIR